MAKQGRPSKLTASTKAKLLTALKAGNHYEPACAYAGIAYSTFREWMQRGEGEHSRPQSKEYADFAEEVHAAVAASEVASVLKIKNSPDWRSAAWLLERRFSDRWAIATRLRVEVEKELDKTLQYLEENLTPDIFEQVLNALANAGEGQSQTEDT